MRIFWIFTLWASLSFRNVFAGEVIVAAAASLDPALSLIRDEFVKKHKDHTVKINYQGSDAIYRGLMVAVPYDLVFLAHEGLMEQLQAHGKVSQRAVVMKNRLVIASAGKPPFTLEHKTIALCHASVPCGIYADQWLKSLNPPASLRVVRGVHAKATLLLLEQGVVDYAIVYQSDLNDRKFKVELEAKPSIADPVYAVGIVNQAKEQKGALAFFQFLQSDEVKAIYQRHGFLVP